VNRQQVEKLIANYVRSLKAATDEVDPNTYRSHLYKAEALLARWRGGDSLDNLMHALRIERSVFESENAAQR